MVMVKNNSFECAMGLLAKGANADVQDIRGNSPLHRAVEVCVTLLSLSIRTHLKVLAYGVHTLAYRAQAS